MKALLKLMIALGLVMSVAQASVGENMSADDCSSLNQSERFASNVDVQEDSGVRAQSEDSSSTVR